MISNGQGKSGSYESFAQREQGMDASDNEGSAGRALLNSLIAGREAQTRQQRFRQYLNAYAIAGEIVTALSRRPGLTEMNGSQVMEAMEELVKATAGARKLLLAKLAERGVEVDNPAHVAQINRLVAQTVSANWPLEASDTGMFHIRPRDGKSLDEFPAKLTLLNAYTDYVARQIERESLADDKASQFADDYRLDRLLAAHSMYQRIDAVIRGIAERYLVNRPESFRRLIFGRDGARDDFGADALTHKLIMDVVLPVVDQRHHDMLAVYDPHQQFSTKDRHIAYRALMRTVSKDVALIIDTEEQCFIANAKAISADAETRASCADGEGALAGWLRGRLNERLDRVYPRPDEYSDVPEPADNERVDARPPDGTVGKAVPGGGKREPRPA